MSYGPAVLKVQRTEKEWPIEPHIAFFMRQFYIQDIVETSLFISLFSKFYRAEWQEEMEDWIDYCSNNINSY